MLNRVKKVKINKKFAFQVLGLLVVLNILYYGFFYEKNYEMVSISTELLVSDSVEVWYVYKEDYGEKRFFSEKKKLISNEKQSFTFNISSTEAIEYIGLYWKCDPSAAIDLRRYSYTIKDNNYFARDHFEIVDYANANANLSIIPKGIRLTSSQSTNWVMLNNTDELNDRRDFKVRGLMPWWLNLFLLAVFSFTLYKKREQVFINSAKTIFSKPVNFKTAVLSIWVFLMPFWIIVSHILMGIIVLYELIKNFRNRTIKTLLANLKVYYPFFAFYICLVLVSCYTSTNAEIADTIVDYSYFVFMPFVFAAMSDRNRNFVFEFFKRGLLLYAGLFLTYTLLRYYKPQESIAFAQFLELDLEMFWHTSYFSIFFLLLFIKDLKRPFKKNGLSLLVPISVLVFIFIINARMPFLIGVGLLLFRAINNFQHRKHKVVFAMMLLVVLFTSIGVGLLKHNQPNENKKLEVSKLDARLSLWESAIGVSVENIFFGVGPENVVNSVASSLSAESATKYRGYNVHNQFLETFLGSGIFSLLLLGLMLFYGYRKRTTYSIVFVLSFCCLFSVETYFEHQAGVILFTFWHCFFISSQNNKVIQNRNKPNYILHILKRQKT